MFLAVSVLVFCPITFAAAGDPCGKDDVLKAGESCCGGVKTSIIKCDQNNETGVGVQGNSLWGVLSLAINILTAGIGIAAVAGIIYGAVLYSSAGGGQENVKKAKEIIQNVVIGLLAYGLMYALLNYIIPGGIILG